MDYEQKYKKALEMAREAFYNQETPYVAKAWLLTMFPTIAESTDERIRKGIIELVKQSSEVLDKQNQKDMIDWLEKQGKQTHAALGQSEVTKISDQELSDKVKPKFKVGDWIILPLGIIAHIDSLNSTDYQVTTTDGKICDFKILKQDNYRLWNIEDARDSDVLVASDGSIFLFAGVDDGACKYYVALTTDNCLKINKEVKGGYWETSRAVYPATKEQRDTLIKAMANAGYTFDFEKKEFKEIKPKTLDPDKVIEWLKAKVYDDSTYGMAMIDQFKTDFGL